jgi:hypothetical protein
MLVADELHLSWFCLYLPLGSFQRTPLPRFDMIEFILLPLWLNDTFDRV